MPAPRARDTSSSAPSRRVATSAGERAAGVDAADASDSSDSEANRSAASRRACRSSRLVEMSSEASEEEASEEEEPLEDGKIIYKKPAGAARGFLVSRIGLLKIRRSNLS